MTDLPLTKTTVSYSGAAVTYTVVQDGTLAVKLWGAGGGGAVRTTANWPEEGGTGGFTYVEIPVVVDDVIEISVGQGGKSAASTTTGGIGGWPDGGSGGVPPTTSSLNTLIGCAGGGGSTRIKLNGTLIAVAGAGGGGVNFFPGGHGGGEEGLQNQSIESPALALVSSNRFNGAEYHATGGTQTAGGHSLTFLSNVASTGTQTRGGNGWRDSVGNGTTPDNSSGAGGGGGYWGGGAGASDNLGFFASGGGGSGYVADGYTGFTRTGRDVRSAPYDVDSDFVAGIGLGSPGVTTFTANPAGNGQAVFYYKDNVIGDAVVEVNAYPLEQIFTVDADTPPILDFYMWGGAGGGGQRPVNASNSTSVPALTTAGGAGGATFITLAVEPGDVIKLKVGMGGEVGRITTGGEPANINAVGYTGTGGAGGWPDGGQGGATRYGAWGGGGGATYLYLNDVLMAIAGGGGGASIGDTNRVAGAGGGSTGQTGTNAQTPTYVATGGTQSAGGTSGAFPTDAGLTGGPFAGGAGFRYSENETSNGGTTHVSGGGGGGGYYGGAGGSCPVGASTGLGPPGGGGSGYLNTGHAAFIAGDLYASNTATPAQNTHARYRSNVAIGGQARWSENSTYAGGDGQVIIAHDSVITTDSATIEYSGAPMYWIAPATGVISLKAWGGGGAAAWRGTGIMGAGGPGGYAESSFTVLAGQLVKFEVGQGGQVGIGSPASGGLGGWPDGGNAGWANVGGNRGGGGGGSSRVWIDDVLKLVAGAGGGGGRVAGNIGGAGGGTVGEDSSPATGGTQSTGGTQPNGDTQMQGSYLQGGLGYPAGQSPTVRYNLAGSGGGGGYYGGGGGYRINVSSGGNGSGAGGSGYDASGFGTLTTSVDQSVPNSGDTEYVAGVGTAGVSNTNGGVGAKGGDGLIYFSFSPVEPGDALGDLSTVSMVALTGGVQVGIPEGDVGQIDLTAPTGFGGTLGIASGDFGDFVEMLMFLNATGVAAATVNVAFSDDDIQMVSPEVVPAASASVVLPLPGPIRLTPPRVYFEGIGLGDPFENDIVLTVPTVIAEEGVEAFGEAFDPIVLTAPEAAGTGAAQKTIIGPYFAQISLTAPTGTSYQEIGEASGAIGTITLVDMIGYANPEVVEGLAFDSIVMTAPEGGVDGFATGEALTDIEMTAVPVATVTAGVNAIIAGSYIARVLMSAPAADVTAGVDLTPPTANFEITLSVPAAITNQAANVAASILPARILVRRPVGVAYEGDGALAVGDLIEEDVWITVTPPEAVGQIIPEVRFDPIQVDYIDGYAAVDVEGFAPLRFKRSLVPGNIPSLVENEIAINEADGILYTRDGSGSVKGTYYLPFRDGAGFAPAGGSSGNVLTANGWSSSAPAYESPLKLPIPTGQLVTLTDEVLGTEIVEPDLGKVYYRPFYLPKKTTISTVSVEVVATSNATVWLGICKWTPQSRIPGDTVVLGSVAATSSGQRQIAPMIDLPSGWYAAMIHVTGVTGTTFMAATAPKTFDSSLSLVGDPTADGSGGLDPAPVPNAYATDSWGIVQAEVA